MGDGPFWLNGHEDGDAMRRAAPDDLCGTLDTEEPRLIANSNQECRAARLGPAFRPVLEVKARRAAETNRAYVPVRELSFAGS